MKPHLFLLLCLGFLLSKQVLGQCVSRGRAGGGYSGRNSSTYEPPAPIISFNDWEQNMPVNGFSLLSGFSYQQLQWIRNGEKQTQSARMPELVLDLIGYEHYFGVNRRWSVNFACAASFPLKSKLPTLDNSFSVRQDVSAIFTFGFKNYFWVFNKSRLYVSADISFRKLKLITRRDSVGSDNTKKWYADYLKRQTYSSRTLKYDAMLAAMQYTEREQIPMTNANFTSHLGLGLDFLLLGNIFLKIETGIRYDFGLLERKWDYEYCESCNGKKVQFKGDVIGVPYSLETNALFFFKIGLVGIFVE